ncbi:hypothetical protein [Chryseobacterium indoltheticum]|uniref:Major membrane immunogen, membrane-anchored lipoprotein n=1 Tax=Chryseobacterium indoltheticum TaxID=254 RepID=A0A381FH76_9FLAO|nr:hypothetical protein [Chryseobacterium indoltheticum]SUX45905.1 Major membrane immunogen, membrane-anchored lipoprotein [Chryseobacterium indoltheticum]
MKRTILLAVLLTLTIIIFCCSPKAENVQGNNSSNISFTNTSDEENDEDLESSDSEGIDNFAGCKFEDGTYSATVDYNNPETAYSATYTLDVDVRDCQVVQINFPNDGYLDDDHISYADIDDDGNANVDGEDGKTYQIQIDN